jgi:AcrR family transcriptional regulator
MVYSENMIREDPSRPYRKRRRAESEEETRLRITEAAVGLHGTVGPVRTTVAEVARRAGVSRRTVYDHFPTGAELFQACSRLWTDRNPLPDPAAWTAVADPPERLVRALRELYDWYRRKQDMVGNVVRDTAVVPPLAAVMDDLWAPWLEEVVRALARGWTVGRRDEGALCAALQLAVDFGTWQSLARSGLDPGAAADLAARMVTGALGPLQSRPSG